MAKHRRMNKWQQLFCRVYAEGDFAYLQEEAKWRECLDECSDGYLRFMLIELSTAEDCTSLSEAMRRMTRVNLDTANFLHELTTLD
jgi:hypothetical protein